MADSDFEQLGLVSASGMTDFVPVAFTSSPGEAEHLRAVLEAHHIPTLIDAPDSVSLEAASERPGTPLLVPAEMFDEATEILAIQDDEDDTDEDYDDEDDEVEDDDYDEDDFDDYDEEDDEDEDFLYDDEDDEDEEPDEDED